MQQRIDLYIFSQTVWCLANFLILHPFLDLQSSSQVSDFVSHFMHEILMGERITSKNLRNFVPKVFDLDYCDIFCSKNRFNLFVLCSSAFDTLDHPKIAFCFRSHPLLKPWTSKQSYFSWLQIFLASCVSSQENSYAN